MRDLTRRIRRLLIVAAAVAGIGAGLPATAGEGAAVVGMRVERYLTVTVTVRLEAPPTVTDARGFERWVDPTGRRPRETAVVPSGGPDRLVPLGDFGCVPEGTAPGFVDHGAPDPVRVDADLSGGRTRSLFHLYTLPAARQVEGRSTLQVLACLAGGAQATNGWRLLQAGVGAAFDSRDEPRQLGMAWPAGSASADTTMGWAFASSHPVGAVGWIRQPPGGHLKGSLIGPVDSDFDDLFANAVAGWWQDPCLDDAPLCHPGDGRDAFQGSLAGGLWEFFADDLPPGGLRFRLAAFTTLACLVGCAAPAGRPS